MKFNYTKKATSCLLALSAVVPLMSIGQGLKITPGANVVVNNAANIVINDGGIINDGTFTAGTGTVTLTGSAAAPASSIGGATSFSFYNLGINKSGGNARLVNGINVTNSLLMQNNNLDLNGFDLNLLTLGTVIGENANSRVTSSAGGFLIRTASLNAPSAANPGNIGIEITSSANLGTTVIKRGHQQQVTSSGFSINRFFDIVPANNSALNATAKMFYFDAELAGINEAELKQWASANNGASWNLLGADAQDATANFVAKNSINSFNRLTLASSINNPLPVQLLAFNGQLQGNDVLLTWSTASQVNTRHFELQRSADGRSFTSISTTAAINGNTPRAYGYVDKDPFFGVVFYRLKVVDNDGTFRYSSVVAVNKGLYTNLLLNAYPTPTHGLINIRFTSSSVTAATVQLTDVNGTVVLSKAIIAQKGLNEVQYNLANLAQGTYFLRLTGIDNKIIKIIKD